MRQFSERMYIFINFGEKELSLTCRKTLSRRVGFLSNLSHHGSRGSQSRLSVSFHQLRARTGSDPASGNMTRPRTGHLPARDPGHRPPARPPPTPFPTFPCFAAALREQGRDRTAGPKARPRWKREGLRGATPLPGQGTGRATGGFRGPPRDSPRHPAAETPHRHTTPAHHPPTPSTAASLPQRR